MAADRLLALAESRPWAMSLPEVVAGFDAAHGLLVEAQAVVLRYARQVDLLRAASRQSASSTAVWYRNRHRVAIRSAHQLVRIAKRVAAAPEVLGEAETDQTKDWNRAAGRLTCDRDARWCDSHHLRHWGHYGPTALDNLVLVCAYHHGELHKTDGWTAYMDTDGLPTFVPPAHVDPLQLPRRNRYHRRQ